LFKFWRLVVKITYVHAVTLSKMEPQDTNSTEQVH